MKAEGGRIGYAIGGREKGDVGTTGPGKGDEDGFEEKNIGYYYVFDKGDKIDFNHPNRKGHFVIASEISRNKICQN